MTEQEYKQKRRECFVKFCKDNGIDQEVNISIFDAFDQIFDRAYSLGKQEKDAEDNRTLKVNRQLFCRLCADADVPKNAESGTHSFSHILKDDFRDHNRLHIAAMAMQGILSNADRMNKYEYVATEPPCAELAVVVARNALRYADALISECKKGGGNA